MAIFLAPLVRWALGFAGVLAILTWFGAVQRSAVRADLEKQDNATAGKIKEAGDRSDSVAPGRVRKLVRDPHAVSE